MDNYPEVENFTRIYFQGSTVKYQELSFYEKNLYFVDSTFFDIFSFEFIEGDPLSCLTGSHSMVVTESTAKKYFGNQEALGEILEINNESFTVTAVVKDVPQNTHFHFDMAIASHGRRFIDGLADNWINGFTFYTYLKINDQADPTTLEAKIPELLKEHLKASFSSEKEFDSWLEIGNSHRYFLQPLHDIHLKSKLNTEIEANGDINYILIFSGIGILIIIIGIINFINLTTARASNRAKEVGVRKSIGSTRQGMISQFVLESAILTTISVIIAMIMAYLVLPFFNQLVGQTMSMDLFLEPQQILIILLFIVFIGLVSGGYPALYLSSFKPAEVLKGRTLPSHSLSIFRNSMVLFQFVISISLIISTLLVYRQIKYMLNKDLGFNTEKALVINNIDFQLRRRTEPFKQELLTHSQISSISFTNSIPGQITNSWVYTPSDDQSISASLSNFSGDKDVIEAWGLNLVAGRNFMMSDTTERNIILNKAGMKLLGWDESSLGNQLTPMSSDRKFTLIGIIDDFHFESLHNEVGPLMFFQNERSHNQAVIRLSGTDMANTIKYIEDKWKLFVPGKEMEYSFMDQDFNSLYVKEEVTGKLALIFCGLAWIIACLGLFGLSIFAANQRAREMSIRKVLGASGVHVFGLLSKNALKLIVSSLIIAAPISYFSMSKWLQTFAYRIEIPWWIFIVVGAFALLIAIITISWQSIKVSIVNPTQNLKIE
jgi:putative ABC transport system permease protein